MPKRGRTVASRFLFTLCTLGLWETPALAGDGVGEPPRREARLDNGRRLEYSILFDRNSLTDSVRVGEGLIALTTAGALLRFDLPAVRLSRERTDLGQVTCLGHGEGDAILAGLADGRVCRVDPVTLDLVEVVKVAAPPRWIGWGRGGGNRPAGLIVVTRPTKRIEQDGRHYNFTVSVVNDLASGKTFALEREAGAFLLDRAGRFWLGIDDGEWGGQIHQVNLARGTISELQPPPSRDPDRKAFWSGVYGFIELRDGQIWAYGGTMHMGFNNGYVTRIDAPKPQPLFECQSSGDPANDPPRGQPRRPFTQILEEETALRVFSYNDVFQVDPALKNWKPVARLDLGYRSGRPDAVGAYPAIRAIHPPARPGEPYILATLLDGYVLLKDATVSTHTVPNQLGAEAISTIECTPETIFFHDGYIAPGGDDERPIWKLERKSGKIVLPPAPIGPAPRVEDPLSDIDAFHENGVDLNPSAWTPWTNGTFLLATDLGFRSFDAEHDVLSKVDIEAPPNRDIRVLARDGLGRLWIGCQTGLWMVDAGAKTPESFEKAPWIGLGVVTALAADPGHQDGVVVALRDRGVVFLRALPKP